jgi:phosphatidylglycerophosphatase A
MKSQKIIKFFLSFFGVGFIKYAPGTFGSIATIPFMYFISLKEIPLLYFVLFLVALTALSCVLAEYIQKKEHIHDPGWIVIDEVIGMLVTWLLFYPTFNFQIALSVLIVFRFFDIIKFWPASYFDKQVTNGFGTIIDDVLSAFYAIGVLYILQKFITIS